MPFYSLMMTTYQTKGKPTEEIGKDIVNEFYEVKKRHSTVFGNKIEYGRVKIDLEGQYPCVLYTILRCHSEPESLNQLQNRYKETIICIYYHEIKSIVAIKVWIERCEGGLDLIDFEDSL